MFHLFRCHQLEVVLDTQDDQHLAHQIEQQNKQGDREEEIEVGTEIGFVGAEILGLDDKADALGQCVKKENTKLKEELKKLKAMLKITGANENIDKYLKLKMDIFDGEDIENTIIDRAFLALTNKEKALLEYYYGLNVKERLSWKEIANIYEIASIQYTLNKLKKDFKNICLGLKTKNPYIELLTDREKLLSLAFTLPKEERDAFILKNGLFTCNRASNKEISETLGIPYIKVKKVIESAEEKVREMVKR